MQRSISIQGQEIRRRREASQRVWKVLDYLFLALIALFFLFPLIFMFITAFKNDEAQINRDLGSLGAFVPYGELGIQNFKDVFERTNFLKAFFNSSIVVSAIVILGLVVNSAFAYALARFRFFGRDFLLSLVVSLIIIPFQAVAVPLLLLVNNLPWLDGSRGWLDSYHVQIIPFAAHAFSVYLFYQFFISMPKELEEAATVDGASRLMIYWRIVLPLSGPVFATVAILQFLARWGELLWPVMAVRGDTYSTLPLAMQNFFGTPPYRWGDIIAFATMLTLPTLIVFLLFQRWFVQSAVSSGVKG
jgi:multiple sugar transport system permease protein